MKRVLLAAMILLCGASPAFATGPVFIQDATTLSNTVKVNSDGSINVDASGSGGATTANQGTPNTLANGWPTKITDGTNGPAAVKPASTAPLTTDPALVVAISPNSINPNGQATKVNSAPVTIASDQAPLGAAGSDGSTTITSGGTAQNLFSAATPADGFEVCNPDASEDLWISWSTTAAANATGSTRVPPNGGCYDTPEGMRPFHAVSIIGATTGHKITATQW